MYKIKHKVTGQIIEVSDKEYRGYPFYQSSFNLVEKKENNKPVEIKVEPKPKAKEETKEEVKPKKVNGRTKK